MECQFVEFITSKIKLSTFECFCQYIFFLKILQNFLNESIKSLDKSYANASSMAANSHLNLQHAAVAAHAAAAAVATASSNPSGLSGSGGGIMSVVEDDGVNHLSSAGNESKPVHLDSKTSSLMKGDKK